MHGMQPPKTEENETATNKDPAPCHILKCPNRSIYHINKEIKIIKALCDKLQFNQT